MFIPSLLRPSLFPFIIKIGWSAGQTSANYFFLLLPHWRASVARWEENAPVQTDARCWASSRWHSWHCSGWTHSECITGCLHQQLQRRCWCKTIPSPQLQRSTVRLQHAGTDGSETVRFPLAAGVTWLSYFWTLYVFSIEVSTNTGLVPCYVSAGFHCEALHYLLSKAWVQ